MFHDAFHFDANLWNNLFADDDHENVVMDTHKYYAWNAQHGDIGTYCDDIGNEMSMAKQIKYDVWVGEWSLATDTCAHWLEGFNNGGTSPSRTCKRVECPHTYMKEKGVDFDRKIDELGPFGKQGRDANLDHVTIKKGTCTIDSDFYSEEDVMRLGQCYLDIFNDEVQAHFMWTVRNELEPRWNYVQSYDKGWIKNKSDKTEVFLQ